MPTTRAEYTRSVRRPGEVAVVALAGAATAIVSALIGMPVGAVAGVGLSLLAWVVQPVFLRVVVVVFGTLLLFQNDSVPGAVKLAFLAACWVFGIVSIRRVLRAVDADDDAPRAAVRRALVIAAILAIVPVLSIVQIGYSGATLDAWLRDAVGYLLLPVAILVGLDAALSLSSRLKWALAIAASTLAAASALGTWLSRRGGAELGFGQLGLASSLPVFIGIALSLAMYFNGARRSMWWLVAALFQIGLLVATGGRQPALFAVIALLLGAAFAGGNYLQRLLRVTGVALAAALTYATVIMTSEQYGGGIAARRLDFFDRVVDVGWSAVASDGSVLDRTNAYRWAFEIWLADPLFGRGLGLSFPSVRSGLVEDGTFTLDTPIIGLAKFGILGFCLVGGCIVAILLVGAAARKLHVNPGLSRVTFTVVASGLLLATLPNGFPPENRGFPLFVLLFVLIAIPSPAERRSPSATASAVGRESARLTSGRAVQSPSVRVKGRAG